MCPETMAKQTKRHYISPVPTQGLQNSTSVTFVSFAPHPEKRCYVDSSFACGRRGDDADRLHSR